MITIPAHNYPEAFANFCFNSVLNKDQAIRAMQEIRKECNDVLLKDIYNPNITKPMKVTDFNQIQKSSTSQISYYLKETWVNKIKDIVKTNFAEDPGQSQLFGRPWYSLNENSKESYESGKLKKFLTQTKFVMEDTLLYMTEASVKRFVAAICEFVPLSTEILNSNEVINEYYSAEEIAAMGAPRQKMPLFHVDLTVGEDRKPKYSTSAKEVVSSILTIFDSGIKSLQEITQVEQKLLPHLFKTNAKMFLKATHRPDFRPEEPSPDDLKELPNENTWVFDEFNKLRDRIANIIEPMEKYITTFDKYQKEYELDPEKIMAQWADPDDWPEVDVLRADINFHKQEDKRLQAEIPEEITVSIFKISTKVIRDELAAKHRRIAEEEVVLISKIAQETSNSLMKEFEVYNHQIEQIPKSIEELSAIKEIMQGLPSEMEKKQVDIKKCMDIYATLDNFHHKFADGEDYDKMWRVYGAPRETKERIEKQQGFLEKEKEKFIKKMENDKKDFNNTISELETLAGGFKHHSDVENYEQISQEAKNIKQRIDDANEYAKKVNNCEGLVDYDDISDYTSIPQMQKDFKAFYDLWTVVEEWKKSYNSWLYDPFDEIDAAKVEQLVEDSSKTMSSAIRFFRDKDELRKILKIAEDMRTAVEEFKPEVPIVMALRTDGMKDRHWEMLSQRVGFEVKPYEGFTFQKCMELKLLDHLEAVVDIGEKAGKEYTIETSLAKMKKDWEPL